MKLIHKSYKFRITPNKEQIELLSKHFGACRFVFNHYLNILHWQDISAWEKEALFLRGGNSAYISQAEHFIAIEKQFPNAKIQLIENAGHWLHAEKTQDVLTKIKQYLN